MRLDERRQDREWRLRVGLAIRAARERVGLTQSALAGRIGADIATVSKTELGKTTPDFATIETIADALGLSIDILVGRSEEDRLRQLEATSDSPLPLQIPKRPAPGLRESLEERVADLETVTAETDATIAALDGLLLLLESAEELPESLRSRLRAQRGAA